jgi:hypothetical protein
MSHCCTAGKLNSTASDVHNGNNAHQGASASGSMASGSMAEGAPAAVAPVSWLCRHSSYDCTSRSDGQARVACMCTAAATATVSAHIIGSDVCWHWRRTAPWTRMGPAFWVITGLMWMPLQVSSCLKQPIYAKASLRLLHDPPACSPPVADVKINKLMRLLEGDQKGRADLQRAHELIRAVVQHAPSRPPPDAAARTPLQVPLPAVVRCTCSTGSTALWLRISSANDLMKPSACPLQCCRCALPMHLQARTAQLQGAPAAVVADAPIRINLPHAVRA